MNLKKRVEKNIATILLSALCILPLGNMAYANEAEDSNLNQDITNDKKMEENIQARLVGWSTWAVKSKTTSGTSYGGWEFGTEGRGGTGATVGFSKSVKVSNSLEGNIKASKSSIEAYMGFKFNQSTNSTAKYSIKAPDSKLIYTINYRKKYQNYKVNQERYLVSNGQITATEKATATAKKFLGFGYDWNTRKA